MSINLASSMLVAMLLCSLRITVWLMIAPPFATAGAPRSIRYILGVALSLAVTASAAGHAPAAEIGPLLGSAVEQIVIGGGLGFLTRLLFSAVESAGSLIDIVGGFSLAFAYDPLMATSNSVFGKFYGLMATTLLFASNAHLVILGGFMRTFTALPLDQSLDLSHLGTTAVHAMTSMFVSALQIAGPLIAVLFLADLGLGILSRISPQLNVFQLSFGVKIAVTLGVVGMGFAILPQIVGQLAQDAASVVSSVVGS